ncbi:MAG: HipA domain-containing protein [Firmicutes bacterium]|nr:HipA domain-containing protein [Bacillota bacterium]
MEVILMNKNTEVLIAEYNTKLKGFEEIIEYKNTEYAPVIIKNSIGTDKDVTIELSKWFRGRGIPNHRDNLEMLLARLNITMPEELLDKVFGLSLSDQYWIKPTNSNIKYKDINFFENDFDSFEFTEAAFSNKGRSMSEESLKTPNNTTDGMLKKSWVIKDGKRYLLKGGFRNELMQPFNEVLASMICERLGFAHVVYTLEILKEKVVSSCECFINTDTEYVPAYQVLSGTDRKYAAGDYETYISILEKNGITNAREKLNNMFILDYIMLNEDRHLNNFGIVRDVNTLEWLDLAPIFDTGESLGIVSYDSDEIIINGQGKFFYNVDSFEDIIKNMDNLKRIDVSKLDDVVREFDNLLHQYQNITNLSDNHIQKICSLLYSRINRLKSVI